MRAGGRLLPLLLLLLLACGRAASFAAKKAPKKKSSKKAAASSAGGGFGKVANAAGPTAAQLLKSSMEEYEALERIMGKRAAADADDIAEDAAGEGAGEDVGGKDAGSDDPALPSVTKYCVAMRSLSSSAAELSDWVPVALLALGSGGGAGDPTALVPSALGACVKEVVEGAAQNIPSVRKVARETVEYAFEPLDSFESHVYEGLQGRAERRSEAAKTLGVESGASAGEVKKAHRKLMMELHPDRFVGDEEGAEAAQARMLDVQEAYAELGGGTGGGTGSFYASIGGKARVGFSGALAKEALSPLGKARPEQALPFEAGGWRVGVTPMTVKLTREFVTRNLMRSRADVEDAEE